MLRYTVDEVRKMNFGIKLQLLRKEKRMSQEALAEQLGVSRQAVSKWECGDGYPEMDKLIMISDLFNVSLDYLMKNNEGNEEITDALGEDCVVLSTVELQDFLRFKERFGLIISLAVASIISSVSIGSLFDSNLSYAIMMLIIAIAIGTIVVIGIISGNYEYLEKKHIRLKPSDLEMIKEKQKKFKTTFAIMIAAGVFVIIAGLALVIAFDKHSLEDMMSSYFLIAVAFGVFLFINAGIKEGTYRQICDTNEYVKEQKEEDEYGKYYAVTMPLAAMAYLLLGFLCNAWHPGWLVFPITAIGTFAFITLKK